MQPMAQETKEAGGCKCTKAYLLFLFTLDAARVWLEMPVGQKMLHWTQPDADIIKTQRSQL